MNEADSDTLHTFLVRVTQDSALFTAHEDATKQGVILPILSRPGWDRDNIREVVPEWRVGNGRVDYCLRAGERSLVFIEAKRTNQNLEAHQEQLLEYAFREGVEMAALTNGMLWWLYLPLLKGSWEQRKFLTIDIAEQGAEAAAEHFRSYLAKDVAETGRAVQRAKQFHSGREKERLTSATLPRAWDVLREGPHESLVELLTEKVESLCGHQPTPDQVAQFLELLPSGLVQTQTTTHPELRESDARQVRRPSPLQSGGHPRGFTFTRPTAFTLFGVTRRVSSFREVLVGVCEAVAARYSSEFDKVLRLRGRTRDFFSRDYRAMTTPELIPGTDIYVETNFSANDAVKRCHEVLLVLGLQPEMLRIESQ